MIREVLVSVLNKEGALAGAAAASPVWLGKAQGALMTVSDFAAALLPILGVGWLAMQMAFATWGQFKKTKDD